MSEMYRKREQALRLLLERNLTEEGQRDLRTWMAEVHDCADEEKSVWELMKDMDIVSPDKGYDELIQALNAIHEKKLAVDVNKVGKEVMEGRKAELEKGRRTSVDGSDNRKSGLRKMASFEQDPHKDLMKKIGTQLKAGQIRDMKNALTMMYPSHFPLRIKDQEMAGLELIQLMETRDIIRRGFYEHLLSVLECGKVKKFHKEIAEVETAINREMTRNTSIVEGVKNYPILRRSCKIVRHRDFIHSTYQELQEGLEFTELFLNEAGRVTVPEDAELLVVCSSFSTTDPSKSMDGAFPPLEYVCLDRAGDLPVIYLVDVHCSELPPQILLRSPGGWRDHAFMLLLFTNDKQKAEEMWSEFVTVAEASGVTHPVEKLAKLWKNEIREHYSSDEFSVVTMSTLSGNLFLSSVRRAALM